MKLRSFSLIFVFLLLTFNFVFAARPLSTDDTGTTPKEKWKLEAYGESYEGTSSIGVVGKYGFTDSFEISAGASLRSTGSSSGRGPIRIKGKYRIMDEKGTTPSFGVSGSLSIPEAGDSTIIVNGIMTDTMRDFTYHLNLGLTLIGSSNGLSYSGAVDYPLNRDFNVVGELNGGNLGSTSTPSALIGGKWKIKSNMTLDGGFRIALNENDSSGITIGLTTLL